jgi:ribosomal protein S6
MLFYRSRAQLRLLIELESKLKYDTSVIRHLLLKVDSPSLEDSLLLIESKEAKKAPQDEEQSQEKPKVTPAEKNEAAEPIAQRRIQGR